MATEVAQKHGSICPSADAFEIQFFLAAMSGKDSGPDGDANKPLVSCFAFAAKTGERPVGTVRFPVDAGVKNDSEARARVEDTLVMQQCRRRQGLGMQRWEPQRSVDHWRRAEERMGG